MNTRKSTMTQQPLVCICIPNYNNEVTISETLDSIINQTYKNIIIKIFDNASTDKSIDILRDYEERHNNITVYQNETNIGGERNFNKCIQNLEGELGALYHSDDLYAPTMVEEQVKFLLKHQSCVAVSTDMVIIDENSSIVSSKPLSDALGKKDYFITYSQLEMFQTILKIDNYIVCPSVMIKSNIYKDSIQKYDYENFKTAADLEVWLRVCEFGHFGTILKPLIKYRYSTNSYSYRSQLDIKESDGVHVLKNYYKKHFSKLTSQDKQRYEFYLFKDRVRKTINQIMIDDREFKFDINICNSKVISQSLKSKKNFLFFMVGMSVKILRHFALPERVRERLIELRFNRKVS